MNRTLIGVLILGVVAGGALLFTLLDPSALTRELDRKDPVSLSIFYGGEKSALLETPPFRTSSKTSTRSP
ncbi:MAG: hypothetical protein AAGF74_03050 [Pseudomonadota bacterium]